MLWYNFLSILPSSFTLKISAIPLDERNVVPPAEEMALIKFTLFFTFLLPGLLTSPIMFIFINSGAIVLLKVSLLSTLELFISNLLILIISSSNKKGLFICWPFLISSPRLKLKEITSSNLPVYDNDFYSVMVRRTSGSDNSQITQSFELSVGKYDAGRSKIHLYSTSTLTMPGDLNVDSASYNTNWENDGTITIGGGADNPLVGDQLSGSIMEYRHWTEVLKTESFKNHIANPKAYNGNSLSSSYENLVLRYSFDDNMDLTMSPKLIIFGPPI